MKVDSKLVAWLHRAPEIELKLALHMAEKGSALRDAILCEMGTRVAFIFMRQHSEREIDHENVE